jgi:histidinol-phosphate aminotransferase
MPVSKLSRRSFATALGAGLGAALLPRPLTPVARADAGPKGPILLNSNENPYGPSARARETMTATQAIASRYPDSAEDDLRAALGRHHGVAPEQIVLGCGSGEVLKMADMAFLTAGRSVVVSQPTFEAVIDYARVTKAESVKVAQTSDFRHDLPKMAAACDARTGLVYVCNPNNPTGTIVSADEMASFLDRVPKTATVLVDEAYHHFVEDPRYKSVVPSIAGHPNLVVARTFSKIYGLAGMRLGYAIASRENADALRGQQIWSNANAAVLAAGLVSIEDPGHAEKQRTLINGTKRWLCAELSKDARRYIPSEANFVMIDVGGDVTPLIAAFKQRGIMVGRRFPTMENWLRISIGTQEEVAAFVEGLRAIVPVRRAA